MTATRIGVVIVNYGRHMTLETPEGQRVSCRIKGRELHPVCGDEVRWQPLADGSGLITHIEGRRSLLVRQDPRHGQRPLAANVDRMLVMVAPRPELDPFMLDRYLAAAEVLRLSALLVFNKTDLLTDIESSECNRRLDEFIAIGYAMLKVSVRSGEGLQTVKEALRGHTSVVLGQSGAGKSSLLKALVPEAEIRIGEISQATDEGRHTTSVATLYHLPEGGALIDSPGVRNFHLWPLPPAQLAQCFVEFRKYAPQCRFSNCLHEQEPGCAVTAAVTNGAISARRYQSYRSITLAAKS